MPEISVLLPVYNGAAFLGEALESIFGQTWPDFECIVIDDGSTDGSQEIVRRHSDPRIVFVQNQENIGVARTLNKGMEMARGRFIARMDADDVSHPTRFQRQLDCFARHPDAGLCGTWVWTRHDDGSRHALRFPQDAATLQAYVLFNNPLAHPAVMWRAEVFRGHGLRYDESCEAGQDYELWSRCLRLFPACTCNRFLLEWRVHDQGITHRRFGRSHAVALEVQGRELETLGFCPTGDELAFHRRVGNGCGAATRDELARAARWLLTIMEKNTGVRRYDPRGLRRAASLVWFRTCLNSVHLGLPAIKAFLGYPALRSHRPAAMEAALFLAGVFLPLRSRPTGAFLGGGDVGRDGGCA